MAVEEFELVIAERMCTAYDYVRDGYTDITSKELCTVTIQSNALCNNIGAFFWVKTVG